MLVLLKAICNLINSCIAIILDAHEGQLTYYASQFMPNHGLTHHKLQQKLFLRIYYQKGLQNNILKI